MTDPPLAEAPLTEEEVREPLDFASMWRAAFDGPPVGYSDEVRIRAFLKRER
jgi:hypothetical protein